MLFELKETEKAASLFGGWQETLIWSCLQGIMGKIYVDSLENPVSAMAVLGDFCFPAGKSDREFILSEQSCGRQGFMIMVPQKGACAYLRGKADLGMHGAQTVSELGRTE